MTRRGLLQGTLRSATAAAAVSTLRGAVMAARSGAPPFVFFAFMMVVQFVVVLLFYPETKGFSLEEMELHLAG